MLSLISLYTLHLLIIVYILAKRNTIINNEFVGNLFLWSLIFVTIYITAITDVFHADRTAYSRVFFEIQNSNLMDSLNNIGWEPMNIILMKLIGLFTSDLNVFYIILHIVFIYILLKGIKKIFTDTHIVVIVLFIYLNYAFYFEYTLNGIRQSFAIALLILAIGYIIENKKIKMIITSILAATFHTTVAPLSIGLVIILFFKKIKVSYLTIIYLFFAALYATGLNSLLFEFMVPDEFDLYLDGESLEFYGGANKLRFLIFNSLFVGFFIYFFKYKAYENSRIYQILLKVYLISSIYFLMFGFISYANRIAAYSWLVIPLLLGYIIYKSENYLFKIVMLISIVFIGFIMGVYDILFYYGEILF